MSEDRRIIRRPRPVTGEVEDYNRPEPEDELDEGPSADDIARFGDVTVNCPECGTEMFDDVAICWKCGHAVGVNARRDGGPPIWVAAAAVLVILAFVFIYVLR
jgi:uncharacterized protein (DUF983 family)